MKQNGTLLSTQKAEKNDTLGENHIGTSLDTPMREDAFSMSDEQKIEEIQNSFQHIMEILGLDLTDDSLSGTPSRVAKMYIKEFFHGLNPKSFPDIRLFENKYKYNEMLVEKSITLYSTCEHHFVPIIGKAHVAYISSGKVIGLSKINRVVAYFAKRPQVQERLTMQISNSLKELLETGDVAVLIEATHLCVAARGIKDIQSTTVTTEFSGAFKSEQIQNKFLSLIKN